ncbi:MAG TPA: hypothetical protein VMU16_13195 [Candidatus Binataceae bacterium]|nr:hypothetical protein [Candidatus Binataceae bacterium]
MAVILATTAIVYLHCIGNQFIGDQLGSIVFNRYLASWFYLPKALVNDDWWFDNPQHVPVSSYYRPILSLWLWINYHLFGIDPAGWHAAMIAVNLIVVWLVFRVCTVLSGDRDAGILSAMLFALMPAHAEAVVFAFAPPISAAFALGAFDLYLRRRAKILSLGLFACAMLSYESAVGFPVLIGAHALIFPSQVEIETDSRSNSIGEREGPEAGVASSVFRRLAAAFAETWPYGILVVLYLFLRMWIFGFVFEKSPPPYPTSNQVALTIPLAIVGYLKLLVMQWKAGPAHPQIEYVISSAQPRFYFTIAALCGSLAVLAAVIGFSRHRWLYLYCILWFVITIAPALNLNAIAGGPTVHDRFLYLPSMGFCLMAADLAVNFARGGPMRAKIIRIGAVAVAIGYAAMLFSVQAYWKSASAMDHFRLDRLGGDSLL